MWMFCPLEFAGLWLNLTTQTWEYEAFAEIVDLEVSGTSKESTEVMRTSRAAGGR